MCDQHSPNEILSDQFIHSIRHPKEKKLFYIISCITIFFFSLAFAGTFFRDEIQDSIQENIVMIIEILFLKTKKMPLLHSVARKFLKKFQATTKQFWIFWTRIIIGTLFWGCQWDFSCLCSTKSGKCIEKIAPMAFYSPKTNIPLYTKFLKIWRNALVLRKCRIYFLIKGNGTINAYATCVPEYRDFAAVYSDLIDDCLKNNDFKTLRMVSDMNSDIFVTIM